MSYHIVIPARMASQRLPGKPLAMIGKKTLIEHVYRRAKAAGAESVVIATDTEEICQAAASFGARAVMTSTSHSSGSDRIAETAELLGWNDDVLIVNLQGDEPLMPPACLDQVACLLQEDPGADVASLFWHVSDQAEAADPNVVKVVTARDGGAMYFSRSEIPHPRDPAAVKAARHGQYAWKRHIGLYAYRVGALRAFTAMAPSPLEATEKLEQLRFLESGHRIVMAEACEFIPAGVDTADDLERTRKLISAGG
ncbi:MAG: 3-deoxy-manno-octulosonate cytidylyltransferase [Xanthomonadales bacterium]|jgi:3-deoxy-manno-octulosonate cytidylyltransferase (CMP-KDO synthetase)|nr:3-deoxy-manno-octulosonate cytidylyltransferase [Xanthomonadales bacterium]